MPSASLAMLLSLATVCAPLEARATALDVAAAGGAGEVRAPGVDGDERTLAKAASAAAPERPSPEGAGDGRAPAADDEERTLAKATPVAARDVAAPEGEVAAPVRQSAVPASDVAAPVGEIAVPAPGVAGPVTPRPSDLDDYERALAKARLAAAQGRYDDAAVVLESAATTWPQDFVLRLELAWARLRAHRFVEAEAAYRAALELNAESYEARWGLADALLAQQRWDAARDAYDAMLAVRPGDFEARLGLARVLAGHGQWEAARDATSALLRERDDARVHALQGLAHFWLGELREARAHYERALALAPDDEDARLGLAWVAQRRGRTHDARHGFESVLADQPGSSRGRAGALEGLTALGPEHEVLLHGHALAQTASGHPVRSTEYGVVVGGDARLGDLWHLGARYRRIGRLDLTRSNAPGFSNDEGWLRAGVDRGAWGVTLYGAGVVFTPGAGSTAVLTENGWMVGASARVRAWADWRASLTASVYPSGAVGQGELGAALPLGRHLTLSVAARGQWAQGVPRVAGLGLLEVHGERWSIAAGGGYGAQTHPVELDSLALYNLTDEQRWRATARSQVRLGRYVLLFVSGDVEAWRTQQTSGPWTACWSAASSALGWSFPEVEPCARSPSPSSCSRLSRSRSPCPSCTARRTRSRRRATTPARSRRWTVSAPRA